MNWRSLFYLLVAALLLTGCANEDAIGESDDPTEQEDDFQYQTEKFADIKILRYKIPGWELLQLQHR